jgi:hypothetical protein
MTPQHQQQAQLVTHVFPTTYSSAAKLLVEKAAR